MSARKIFLAMMIALLCAVGAQSVFAGTLDDIRARGTLIVGCDLTAPPYGTVDKSGNPIGLDPSLATLLAKDLGVKLQIIDTGGPNRIAYLLSKKIDVAIAGFSITPDRAKVVDFTDPYFVVKLVMIVNKKKAPDLQSYKQLSGHTVAANKGSTPFIALQTVAPQGTNIAAYDSASEAALAAAVGKADAFVEGYAIALDFVDKYPDTLEIRGPALSEDQCGFGLRQADPNWKSYLNKWIDKEYNNGTLKSLYEQWFKLPWKAGDPRG